MSQYVETPARTFQAGAAIGQYLRVKLSAGKLAVAGIGDLDIGTLQAESFADGDYRAVKLMNAQGTQIMVAAGVIAAGAVVYQAASGKINDVAAGKTIGIALQAASADGDYIEVLPAQTASVGTVVVAATADRTLTSAESGLTVTNLGASGTVLITLPQDAGAGCQFKFTLMAAQALRITPGAAGAVFINGAKQTDNKYVWADDEGEHLTLTADGNGDWVAGPYNGTWGVEA